MVTPVGIRGKTGNWEDVANLKRDRAGYIELQEESDGCTYRKEGSRERKTGEAKSKKKRE